MRLRFQLDSLRETTATEYITRFLFGGTITVLAYLIAEHYGPVIGGLFLAFPGIFPGGILLTEEHKIEREREAGYQGTWSARGEAAVEATGASCGTLGLAAFAAILWVGIGPWGLMPTLVCAGATWTAVSWVAWWMRERM
jgi:hypothetical protein